MGAVLALLGAAAQLEPIIMAELPTIEALINGQTVTTAQMIALWTAIGKLEEQVAAKAAQIEAGPGT